MTLLGEARVYLWYKLRRRSRNARKRAAQARFEAALAALKPGDICIDCGANIGTMTLQMAQSGAVVHAFEPDPDAFAALQSNVAGSESVILHNAAVGTGNEPLKLFRGARCADGGAVSMGSSTVAGKKNVTGEFVHVDQVDLADFVTLLGRNVAILKIDIEGAEVAMLNHLLDMNLVDRFQSIFVETHEKQIPALREATMKLVRRCQPYPHVVLDWW
ncbi:MAG: FkbM family methyltransferase [Hyphomicrobium sp.]|jgi:FkbM family methyltransferase|nr:FkbM family methyltransferase [Hyphomicrobium sp.]